MPGKIRSKAVRATIENKDVLDMFQNVLGTDGGGGMNPKIAWKKYRDVERHCGRFARLLEAFSDSALLGDFAEEAGALRAYASGFQAQVAETFSAPDLGALHPPGAVEKATGVDVLWDRVAPSELEAFRRVFQGVQESAPVKVAVNTCKNLTLHKKSLKDPRNLKDRFLTRAGGLTFAPLEGLPALNFRHIYSSDLLTENDRAFVLLVLHKFYQISHDVYEAASSPDVDVGDFVQIVLGSLDEVKKQIPRCDAAFEEIRKSVGLLEGNFGDYYKDYVASNNPSIIMENFVYDVSSRTSGSPSLTAQFKRIIGHYRKISAERGNNPKLQSLFAQVDKNFQELERRSKVADGEAALSSDSDSDAGAEAAAGAGAEACAGAGAEACAGAGAEACAGAGAAAGKAPVSAAAAERRREKNRKKKARRLLRAEMSLAEELAGDGSAAEELAAAEGSAGDGPAAEEPAAEEPAAGEESAGDGPAAGEGSAGGEPAAGEGSAGDGPAAGEGSAGYEPAAHTDFL